MIARYVIAWIPMVFLEILNGAIRHFGYGRFLNELPAHQVSTLTGIILLGLYVWSLSLRWPLGSSRQALTVGLIWLGMTVSFEFIFGYYVVKHPWNELIQDYNLLEGRLWALVLVTVATAPYVIHHSGLGKDLRATAAERQEEAAESSQGE